MVERRMSEHEDILSVVVAGDRARLAWSKSVAGRLSLRRRELSRLRASSDATPLQLRTPSSTARAEHRLDAGRVEAAIGAQNAEAGAEPLFGMGPAGEHGADQAFGVRPDLAGPAPEPIRRPLGVAPVGAGHMVGVRAVLAAPCVAALMGADALGRDGGSQPCVR